MVVPKLAYIALTDLKFYWVTFRNCVAVVHGRLELCFKYWFYCLVLQKSPELHILTGCLCSDLAVRCASKKLLSWADMFVWTEMDPEFPSNRSDDTLFPLQRLCCQVLLFVHYDRPFLMIITTPILKFELSTLMAADYGGSWHRLRSLSLVMG